MFLLGLCSILQVVFLPGFLLVRALRLGAGVVRTLVLSFALSLLANHLLVLGLVLVGMYRTGVVLGIFALELGLFLWVVRREVFQPLHAGLALARVRAALAPEAVRRLLADRRAAARLIILALAWGVILGYAAAEIAGLGNIFTAWDAIVSWNRWAIEWAQNGLPTGTWEYPQLLPCNYSLTYVFIGDTTIWFFAKAIAFLFCLLLLLGILDLYRQTGHFGYVLGAVFTYGLLWAFIRFRDLSSGYADVPEAFFVFACVSMLIVARRAKDRLRLKYVLVGAALAGGAALTKQSALWVAGLYPLLAWLIVYRRPRPVPSARYTWAALAGATLIPALLTVPWYTYKLVQFATGRDVQAVWSLVRDQHANRTPLERLVHAEVLVETNIPFSMLILAVLTLLFALWDPIHRWLVLLVVVPFYLIWSLAFCYDTRNLAMIAPLAGMAMGVGLAQFAPNVRRLRRGASAAEPHAPGLWTPRWIHLAVPVLAAALVAGAAITRDDLAARQNRLQRQVGVAEINGRLYDLDARFAFRGAILSDYLILRWLPDLDHHYRPNYTRTLAEFRAVYEDPAVEGVLLHVRNPPEITEYLREAVEQGKCREEFVYVDYRLLRKR